MTFLSVRYQGEKHQWNLILNANTFLYLIEARRALCFMELARNHYLNKCWLIINHIVRKAFQNLSFGSQTFAFWKCIWKYRHQNIVQGPFRKRLECAMSVPVSVRFVLLNVHCSWVHVINVQTDIGAIVLGTLSVMTVRYIHNLPLSKKPTVCRPFDISRTMFVTHWRQMTF